MKKVVLLLLTFFLITEVSAQNTEYSIHLNSGFFSFGGESATQRSIIIVSDVATIDNYTNNPYGKENTFSYGVAGQIQRITNRNLIYGLQGGYEVLKSDVEINGLAGEFLEPPEVESGHTTLTHEFMNLYPHVGRRFAAQNVNIDFSLGPEFGIYLTSRENGEATTEDGLTVKTDTKRNDPGTDIRIRPELTVNYENLGISAGYSFGLHNYSENLTGANRERFSRFIRFGITYKIR